MATRRFSMSKWLTGLLLLCIALSPLSTILGLVEPSLLPRSMDALDDSYRFKVGDQIIYRVVEDQDQEVKRIIMDSGEVTLPYIGKVKALGHTAKEVAIKLQPLLEKEYYKQAPVLIALDTERKFRGKAYIFGAGK